MDLDERAASGVVHRIDPVPRRSDHGVFDRVDVGVPGRGEDPVGIGGLVGHLRAEENILTRETGKRLRTLGLIPVLTSFLSTLQRPAARIVTVLDPLFTMASSVSGATSPRMKRSCEARKGTRKMQRFPQGS